MPPRRRGRDASWSTPPASRRASKITALGAVTVADLNSVLVKYGLAALDDEEWATLPALREEFVIELRNLLPLGRDQDSDPLRVAASFLDVRNREKNHARPEGIQRTGEVLAFQVDEGKTSGVTSTKSWTKA